MEAAGVRPSPDTPRDETLDRLAQLRAILPVMAEEMATARRVAARLRIEKRALEEENARLRAALDAS